MNRSDSRLHPRARAIVLVGALLAALAWPAFAGGPTARAATLTFQVNSQTDRSDNNAGDGVCWDGTRKSDGTPNCTLRAAIQEANATASSTIKLPKGTYKLSLGQLVITSGRTVSILGAGAAKTAIDGNQSTRVIDIAGGATVVIDRVMIQNGRGVQSAVVTTHFHGAGIHNHGTLTLKRSALSGNQTTATGSDCTTSCGGGLYNAGTATLVNVTVAYNSSQTGAASGAGIANSGTLAMNNVTIAENFAFTAGGGIWNVGSATLGNSIVSANDQIQSAANCAGTITDGGYNLQYALMNNPTSCGTTIPVADPGLDVKKNGAGFAVYYRIYAWSPAIDAGNPATPGSAGACEAKDERNVTRPQDGNGDGTARCDKGAYERRPTDP